ncbi:GDP-L-fucose synthase [Reichenbachiella versicolor]|uniref:GDP-L-fucose synthase n=1 Tax=Reichenbachiella versicolor TaxID=1821036 RepID=UPI000D6E1443|nr:GDP-L-fucose synthase [Reichenbachiella versicolor]
MDLDSKIYVAGHRGMVGSAIVRSLKNKGFTNIVFKSSSELDLTNQKAVDDFFAAEKPDYVFMAAAKVGGIVANNTYRAQFLYDNLMIESNVIHACYVHEVKKMLFLGSSCIYPKLAEQPIHEDSLLTGPLEYTNEPYAIAKIAGIKLCETYRDQYGSDFISAMPTNLYGPNDNYDLKNSHVLPALIRKFHVAKVEDKPEVEVWGTGTVLREFLYVDDLAEACFFLMKNYSDKQTVNVGYGKDLTIRELAETVKEVIEFDGQLKFDASKPDGTPRKLMSSERINQLGWKAKISLKEGIKKVYAEVDKSDW